jgi:[ribosomal protein S5]-alanine N-acetyltransferase
MSTQVELNTPRLRLREFNELDFLAFREMNSRAEMHTYEREQPGSDETRVTLESFLNDPIEVPRTTYRLAITIKPHDTVKGIVKLARQWEAIREWEVGWAVHPDEWGKGYATEAAWYLMDWGFRDLSIHRIVAFCHASNTASVRVMEKLGMQQDGKLRATRWLHGEWWDEYVYAVLDKEWKTK